LIFKKKTRSKLNFWSRPGQSSYQNFEKKMDQKLNGTTLVLSNPPLLLCDLGYISMSSASETIQLQLIWSNYGKLVSMFTSLFLNWIWKNPNLFKWWILLDLLCYCKSISVKNLFVKLIKCLFFFQPLWGKSTLSQLSSFHVCKVVKIDVTSWIYVECHVSICLQPFDMRIIHQSENSKSNVYLLYIWFLMKAN
jgi:hypothetical protein